MLLKNHDKRNISILALCQAMHLSGLSLIVSTSVLVGVELADNKSYASLPFALQLIATMITSLPASRLMARIGTRRSFVIASVFAIVGALVCTLAIVQKQFALFATGSVLLGIFAGFANYYRFSAADSVEKKYKSQAISYVLAGGVLAAVIGPNLANLTRDVISNANFAGGYASITVLYIMSFILLTRLQLPPQHNTGVQDLPGSGRPLAIIVRQPRFIIAVLCGMLGYAIMSLVMTATPLAMQHHHHAFSDTSFVIQWHVLGMFAPAFFTGHLIARMGVLSVMLTGAVFALACVLINLLGTDVMHFWLALLLLGLSWNFLFIGATTLLTESYLPEERFKTQAINDFLVFSLVAAASLFGGALQHNYGWRAVNYSAAPAIALIFISLLWLSLATRAKDCYPNKKLALDG